MRTVPCSLIITLTIASFAPAIHAEESDEEVAARLHDRRGQELFDSGDFEGALHEMEAAQSVMPSAPRLYNMAVCTEQLGNRQAAIDLYRQFISDPTAPEGRRQRAEQQVQRLEEEIASGATGAGAVSGGGGSGETDEIDEEEGGEESGGEPWSETPSRQRLSPTVFYAMLAVTAAAGIALIATGAVALSQSHEYNDDLVPKCPVEGTSDYQRMTHLEDSGPALVVASNVLLGVTSAAALTTVILAIFTNWSGGSSASRLTLSGGPGFVGLNGSF